MWSFAFEKVLTAAKVYPISQFFLFYLPAMII